MLHFCEHISSWNGGGGIRQSLGLFCLYYPVDEMNWLKKKGIVLFQNCKCNCHSEKANCMFRTCRNTETLHPFLMSVWQRCSNTSPLYCLVFTAHYEQKNHDFFFFGSRVQSHFCFKLCWDKNKNKVKNINFWESSALLITLWMN